MNIIVSYYQFSISSPYSAGPNTLTAGEAQALNLLRADSFRKVAQRRLAIEHGKGNDIAEGDDELLSPQQLQNIQTYLDTYAETFEFKYRELEDRKSLLQQELDNLAANMDNIIDFLQNGQDYPDLQNEARRRLRARSSAISPSDLGF